MRRAPRTRIVVACLEPGDHRRLDVGTEPERPGEHRHEARGRCWRRDEREPSGFEAEAGGEERGGTADGVADHAVDLPERSRDGGDRPRVLDDGHARKRRVSAPRGVEGDDARPSLEKSRDERGELGAAALPSVHEEHRRQFAGGAVRARAPRPRRDPRLLVKDASRLRHRERVALPGRSFESACTKEKVLRPARS